MGTMCLHHEFFVRDAECPTMHDWFGSAPGSQRTAPPGWVRWVDEEVISRMEGLRYRDRGWNGRRVERTEADGRRWSVDEGVDEDGNDGGRKGWRDVRDRFSGAAQRGWEVCLGPCPDSL